MERIRMCGTGGLNTGQGGCPFPPDKIRAIVLTDASAEFDIATFEADFEQLVHADRPNRIYPIGNIAQYAQAGGEPTMSTVGYAPAKHTGYDALTETWSLDSRPFGLFKSVLEVKGVAFRVFHIGGDGKVYAEKGSTAGKFKGSLLSSVYANGTQFATDSEAPGMNINLAYRDIERSWKNGIVLSADPSIVDKANGLQWVELVSVGTPNKYKLINKDDGLDLTGVYGTLLAGATAWSNVTAATFDANTETLTLTPTSGTTPLLKRPSELFALSTPIIGIEQWVA